MFSFLLALSEINSFLALRYFVFCNNTIEGCPLLIVFRRRLAWQLINDPWLRQEEQEAAARAPPAPIHQLITAPAHARNRSGGAWICDAKFQYQQYFCSMKCKKRLEPIVSVIQGVGCARTALYLMSNSSNSMPMNSQPVSLFWEGVRPM